MVADVLLKKCHEKHISVEKPLTLFGSHSQCSKESLLDSIRYGSELLKFSDIPKLGVEAAIVLQAMTNKPFYLRILQFKLQNSDVSQVILAYLSNKSILELQILS